MPYSQRTFFEQRLRPSSPALISQSPVPLFQRTIVGPPAYALVSALIRSDSIVLCDNSAFSVTCADVIMPLLESRSLLVPPEIMLETNTYLAQPAQTPSHAVLKNALREAIRTGHLQEIWWDRGWHDHFALEYYVNLLRFRKELPSFPGIDPVLKTALTRGAPGAAAMAKKLKGGGIADEVLVGYAFFLAARQPRRVYVLTRDGDIGLQAYKLASLLREDYLSLMVAEDYKRNPGSYGDQIHMRDVARASDYCQPQYGFGVSRGLNFLTRFIDRPTRMWNLSIVDIGKHPLDIVRYNVSHGLQILYRVKAATRGKNTVSWGDLNCYFNLPLLDGSSGLDSTRAPYAFFLKDVASPFHLSDSPISAADAWRVLLDLEAPRSLGTVTTSIALT